MERDYISVGWTRLKNRYEELVQQLKVTMPNDHDRRLQAELLLERQILTGLAEIQESLSLPGSGRKEAA